MSGRKLTLSISTDRIATVRQLERWRDILRRVEQDSTLAVGSRAGIDLVLTDLAVAIDRARTMDGVAKQLENIHTRVAALERAAMIKGDE